jgi:hypothetical protein
MGTMAPHILVKLCRSNNRTKLIDGLRMHQGKNWFNLLLPGHQAHWHHPVSEPVGLGYSPFTLFRVDHEAIFFVMAEYQINHEEVLFLKHSLCTR